MLAYLASGEITNVSSSMCTVQQLQELYGLRWSRLRRDDRVKAVVALALCFVIITTTYVYLPFKESIEQQSERYLSILKVIAWSRLRRD